MISKFKALPKGVQRAIIVGSFTIPYICGMIGYSLLFSNQLVEIVFLGGLIAGLIVYTPIYWALVFAGIWIYEGFKSEK